MYLEGTPSGTKGWRLEYRFQGQERLSTLGNQPQVALLEARKRNAAIKEQGASSIDLVLAQLEKLQNEDYVNSPAFRTVAQEWHDRSAATWDGRYARTVMHRLENTYSMSLGTI